MTDAARAILTQLLEEHEAVTRHRRLAEILLTGAVIEGLSETESTARAATGTDAVEDVANIKGNSDA